MNEEVINDLYNNAVSKGYKKSREEFVSLLQSNDAVMNDMYSYVQSKGYKKGVDDFKGLIGATVESPMAVASKKKEDSVSPFVDGGSELTRFDPTSGQVVQETPAFTQPQPEVKVPEQKLPEMSEFGYQVGKPLPTQIPSVKPDPKQVELETNPIVSFGKKFWETLSKQIPSAMEAKGAQRQSQFVESDMRRLKSISDVPDDEIIEMPNLTDPRGGATTSYKAGEYKEQLAEKIARGNKAMQASIELALKLNKDLSNSDVISSLTQVNDGYDLLNFISSSIGQTAAQIPLAIASGGGMSYAMESGNIYLETVKEIAEKEGITPAEVIQQGKDQVALAEIGGAISGSLELFGATKILNAFGLDNIKRDLRKRALKILVNSQVEGATEVGQEFVSRGARGLGVQGELKTPTLTEALDAYAAGMFGAAGIQAPSLLVGSRKAETEEIVQPVILDYGDSKFGFIRDESGNMEMTKELDTEEQALSMSNMLSKSYKGLQFRVEEIVPTDPYKPTKYKIVANEIETKPIQEDAIQEQAAGEVPVQPGATVSEEVAQGEPQAEPQVVTQEEVKIDIDGLPTEGRPSLRGSITTPNSEGGYFNANTLQDGTAYISDIQIGFDENAPRGRGYGTNAYIQIGKKLKELGYSLESTQWDKHTSGISPQALRVWEKLTELGYAKVIGQKENKVYNRETGAEEVKTTPVYEFVTPQAEPQGVTQEGQVQEEVTKPKITVESLETGDFRYARVDDNGDEVGMITTSPVDDKIIIDNVFVDEDSKRKGVATSLIDKVIDDYKGKSYNATDEQGNDIVKPYQIEFGTIVSEEGEAFVASVKEKIDSFNANQIEGQAQEEVVTPQQVEKQRADLDMEVKALEELLDDPNQDPLFKKSDNDTKFGEPADVVEDVVRQINELPSGNVTTTITPKPQKPINIDDLESRADAPVKRTTFDVIKGIPAVFSISDQLRIGNVTNPNTGNVIDKLFGGLGFGFTKGHEGFAWANTTKDEAQSLVNRAVSVYNNNKALFDDWWAKNPEYNGLVPLNIAKMAEGSIMSNEALYRVIKDNFASFPKKNKVDALNYLTKNRIPSIIDSLNKSLSNPNLAKNARKSVEKRIKALTSIQDKIKSGKVKSIDQLLDPSFYLDLSLPVRAELISQLTIGSPNKPGEQKASGLPGKNTVPRALLGINQDASVSAKTIGEANLNKVSLSNAVETITEPAMRDVEPRQIIAIYGIDVLNPSVKETVHPNYKFGVNGRPIGVLENSVSIQEAYPFAYTNILESLIAQEESTGEELKAAPIESLINEKIPVGIGLPNLEFIGAISQGVMSNAQKLSAWINKSFPSVIMSTDAETFANVLKSEGVRVQLKGDEVVYGVTVDGDIYINPDVHNSDSALFNTTIHEFGHVWLNFLETTAEGKKLLNRGVDLVKKTGEYQDQLKKFNGNQTKAANEALAILIGNRGETIANASLKSKFQEWLLGMWKYVKDKFKLSSELTPQEIQDLTLDQFLGTAIADLFSGKALPVGEVQLKKLKNPEAAFSKSDSIDSIVQRGRANGFSEESIKIVLQKRGFTQEAIDAALGNAEPAAKKVEVTEEFAPGYDRVLNEIFGKDGVVAKSRRRGRSEEEAMQNAIDYLQQDTKVYENATDVQREAMVRNVRKEFKKREKAAPTAEKVVGKPKKKEVTVDEMAALKDQIKLEARAAREAKGDLNSKRKALAARIIAARKKGTINAAQARALVNRISRVNLDNPIMVDRLIEYTDKVFDDANYAADMAELRKLQKQAKSRNHTSMSNVVNQFTSINPEDIPLNRIQDYKEALDFLNTRTPFYGKMNEVFDEMLSYKVAEKFDAVKTKDALMDKFKSIMSNQVNTVEDYVALIKDLNAFKRKAYQLLQNDAITQEEYDDLINGAGETQADIEKKFASQIAKIKKGLIAEIKNQRPKVSRDFSNAENDLIRKYLELSDADLQSLSPEELFILNDLLENISNGEIDNFRFNEIISKAYTSDGANRLAKQIDDSKFDMTTEKGIKELSENESSFWEGLLGMGRSKSGALQKFVVSVFNRAIASYESLTRDGYNEFLKIKKKYKMSDKDMHKIGMLTTYLQEYMAQFDSKNKDVKDIGKRDWFKEILNNTSMRNKYSSGKPSVLKLIGLGKSEIDIIEEIWDSLPKDSNGNVDPKAVYDSYMANDGKFFTNNQRGFFDDVMAYKTSEITPKQKIANEINGSSFKEIPFHMMRVRLDGGKTQITPTASSDNGVVRIKAGTGKERVSEKVGPIMTNFEKLFITNLEQTGRDYFLSGALKDINNTLSVAKKNINPEKVPLLDTISGALSEALGYEFDRTRTELILRSLLSARAATTLLNPIRTAVELGATILSYPLRAKTLSGYKDLFGKQKEMSKLLEFTDSPLRLRQNINNAIDINDGRIEPQSRLTKATAYLSGLPERTMMVTSWMPTFKSEFKDITGLDFDMKKFNDSSAYREKYGKAVKEASAVADAQTEKIIGPTTKAGQRREVRIAPKVLANIVGLEGTVSKNTAAGQILGFFSNYPYRESSEFINGFKEAAEVIKDEGALSSLSQLQKPLGIALNVAAYGFLSSVTYALGLMLLGNDDDEERGDELLKDLITGEGFLNELASNAISLAGSRYAAGGKAMLQLAATILIESTDDEELKAKYKKLLKDSVFVDPLPIERATKFGGRDKALSAIAMYIPQFVMLADRYTDFIGSTNEVKEIYNKVGSKGFDTLTEDEGLKVLALNTVFNAAQLILNLRGSSIPMYNNIKTYMKGLKEDAGVADVYKGEVPAKKSSKRGAKPKQMNKADLKRYNRELYDQMYGPDSPGYEIEQEVKAFEKQQREIEREMKDRVFGVKD
jgi:predicted GNAT family acetyltransferase